MKQVVLFLIGNLATIGLVIGSIIMGLKGVPGWGWMVFASIVSMTSISFSDNEQEE